MVKELDKQLLDLLDSRSEDEFYQVRGKTWPRYIRALSALQDTAANLIPQLTRITQTLIANLSADLSKQELTLGSQLVEQSIFTLWMMQKIRSLGREISSAGEPQDKAKEAVLLREYIAHSVWAQLHLDAIFARGINRPIRQSIWEPMCNGLRSAVTAYAVMKDALYLRQPKIEDETPLHGLPWDDEDEELLASSMED